MYGEAYEVSVSVQLVRFSEGHAGECYILLNVVGDDNMVDRLVIEGKDWNP